MEITKEESEFIMQHLLFDAVKNRDELNKILNRIRSVQRKDEINNDSIEFRIRSKFDNNFVSVFKKMSKIACKDTSKSIFDYGQHETDQP